MTDLPPAPKKKRYMCNYRQEWEKEYKWLQRDVKDSQHGAFCNICCKSFSISSGGKNAVARHGKGKAHLRAMDEMQPVSWTASDDDSIQVDDTKLSVVRAELLFAYHLAEHNISMLTSSHSSHLFSRMFPDSSIAKRYKSSRTKTTALIIESISKVIHEQLVGKLKQSYFSLLMDESTDISVDKQACLVVRMFDEASGTVNSKFLSMVSVPLADADHLFNAIDNLFEVEAIPYSNMVGFGSDGASVMLGKNNSVVTRLKNKQPNLFHLHCLCHVAHLCASDACKKLPKCIEQLCRDIITHFNQSAKRQWIYSGFQEFVNVKPHKLLRPAQTRWLSLEQCVCRIVEQWPALVSYFQSIDEAERFSSVEKITTLLFKPSTLLYFLFLKDVLPLFTAFNLIFQSEKPSIHVVHEEMVLLLRNFYSRFIKNDVLSAVDCVLDVNYKNENNHLPHCEVAIGSAARILIEKEEIEGHKDVDQFFINCIEFFVEACHSLIKRLQFNNTLLKNLRVLCPSAAKDSEAFLDLAMMFPNVILSDKLSELREELTEYQLIDVPLEVATLTVDRSVLALHW